MTVEIILVSKFTLSISCLFGAKVSYEKFYCVTKNQLHIAYMYQFVYLSIFLSFQQKCLSQTSQLLAEPVS